MSPDRPQSWNRSAPVLLSMTYQVPLLGRNTA
jgi:hypothetical protein